jgi:hypothetical protein
MPKKTEIIHHITHPDMTPLKYNAVGLLRLFGRT